MSMASSPSRTGHPIDSAIALEPAGDDLFRGHTSPAYANMIGPYGGITVAQALNAIMGHPKRIGEPTALTANFAAALADGPFVAVAKPVRTNRSTQHWSLELRQGEQVALSGVAVTALRRKTWSSSEAPMPAVPKPLTVGREKPRAVEFIHRYEMRFVEGSLPAVWDEQPREHSRTRAWVRDDPPRPLDYPALAAMADIFLPRVWLRRSKVVPIGTVSLSIYFHADVQQLEATGSGYLLAQAQGQEFRDGYYDQYGQLWNEAGELMVATHQLVYFKE